jgi:3-oxoacyl-[acyl-carrier-protein] synthase III
MRYEQLFLAGLGSYLPNPVQVDDAVADGRYDLDEQLSTGLQAVCVAGPGDSQPDMAVRAGRVALDRSGHAAGDVSLLLHTPTTHSGLEGWNASAYLQTNIVGDAGVAFELRQLSNGAVAAVELAAAFLGAAPDRDAALITASDRFAEPTWDRWHSSWGLVFADGASAAVFSRRQGFAAVRSTVTVSDPGL